MLLKVGTGNGERGTGNGERGTGNGERGTGNREPRTGNRGPETGVWGLVYSSNPPENSKWRTKEKKGTIWENAKWCYGCQREFLQAVPPDHVTNTLPCLSRAGGASSEAWDPVSMIAPVKKFGRARLSTGFRVKETWRTSVSGKHL